MNRLFGQVVFGLVRERVLSKNRIHVYSRAPIVQSWRHFISMRALQLVNNHLRLTHKLSHI